MNQNLKDKLFKYQYLILVVAVALVLLVVGLLIWQTTNSAPKMNGRPDNSQFQNMGNGDGIPGGQPPADMAVPQDIPQNSK